MEGEKDITEIKENTIKNNNNIINTNKIEEKENIEINKLSDTNNNSDIIINSNDREQLIDYKKLYEDKIKEIETTQKLNNIKNVYEELNFDKNTFDKFLKLEPEILEAQDVKKFIQNKTNDYQYFIKKDMFTPPKPETLWEQKQREAREYAYKLQGKK